MRRSSDNQSVMNRIMRRFRPIAPKPVGGKATSGAADQERENGLMRRGKRKYVRARGRQGKQSARTKDTEVEKKLPAPEKVTVTLQLLPERSETELKGFDNRDHKNQEYLNNTDRCNVGDGASYEVTTENSGGGSAGFRTVGSVIETLIIVECVTDTFADQVWLGFSDKEKIYSLEKETCPGFISDGTNNVIWVNEAYRKMVSAEGGLTAAEKGCLVWLVVKDELPHFYPSFTCIVSLIQQRRQGQKWNKIVPCDVWRMEFAGFAWKLDVNTALSL